MRQEQSKASFWLKLAVPFLLTVALSIPGLLVSTGVWQIDATPAAVCNGLAIVAASFMLGWIGEAAELDLSGGLAIGLLAVITILPEYVVSVYFAFASGTDPSMLQYASANVTGANRLLLGFGWPAVALFGYLAAKRRGSKVPKNGSQVSKPSKFGINLEPEARTDLSFLAIASALCLLIPITGNLNLIVGLVLVLLFIYYLVRQSRVERDEPKLEGTAAVVARLPKVARWLFMAIFAAIAAIVILVNSEPFVTNLIYAGSHWGVDQYLLVQWVAPLASEAPEFALAMLFAFKGRPNLGLSVLLSSKVNQWTALAGSLPIAYVVGGGPANLPMDGRQAAEFMLTAAQTLMGVALLLTLRLGVRSSIALFVLFAAAFLIPDENVRMDIAWLYFAVAAFFVIRRRRVLKETLLAAFKRT